MQACSLLLHLLQGTSALPDLVFHEPLHPVCLVLRSISGVWSVLLKKNVIKKMRE